MDHLDLAAVLTTPPQWNLPAFDQQDAIYLSSSRQMLEPIMEETSEDEEYTLNSWQQYEQQGSDAEYEGTTEAESLCGGTGGAGGASFWSSAESDTGSVIRVEVNKDNDSTSERDFLCPAKRPRRCEESLAQSQNEDEVVLRRPLYADLKNNSLERFLNCENFSRDSWGANSQQRSSVGSRRGFDDFYSDSDSLSYNSLSRSSSLIQFESLERQLLMHEQHASMNSLGNSSPSLLSFETNEDASGKAAPNSANNSANNSRRGSQSSLLKKYESLDGRLHQTYYDLDKLNFDDMNKGNSDNFSRTTNLKITTHMAELRSDSESSSEGSEGTSRPQSVLSPSDCQDNDFIMKKFNRNNSQQSKKGKNSAENLSEDSGYCEPSLGLGLRRSKSQSLLTNYEKFSEEEEEMENKSLLHNNNKPQTFIELNGEHSITNEFKNITTRQETIKSPPLSPQLEFIRHKQRTEAHSPSPVSSEVSTSSSTSSQSTNSNNSQNSCSSATSTSSATTCASKASFTWLIPSAASTVRQCTSSSRVLSEEEISPSQISINDLRELQTSNEENVQAFSGKLKNIEKISSLSPPSTRLQHVQVVAKENIKCLECKNILEPNECRNCGEKIFSKLFPKQENIRCQKCKENFKCKDKIKNHNEITVGSSENLLKCENCGENLHVDSKFATTLNEKVRKKLYDQQLQLLTNSNGEFAAAEATERHFLNHFGLEYDSAVSTPESSKTGQSCENSPKTVRNYKQFNGCRSSTPEGPGHLLTTVSKAFPLTFGCSASSDSDYSPLRLRKNFHSLMPSWPVKTSSVPNELNTLGRKKKYKKAKTASNSKLSRNTNSTQASGDNDSLNDSLSSIEELNLNIKRSLSWSFHQNLVPDTPTLEAKNLGLLHQSYHNLALLNLEFEEDNCAAGKMAEKRISSDYETEIVCKNNFLLDELSAHFDRTASILTDKPADEVDADIHQTDRQPAPKPPQRMHHRRTSNSSCSATEESETEQIQHVSLVIRKPPARQKRDKAEDKTNSLTQDYSFASIMQSGGKTFDQDPTILKTSYAQSLEKCNFDCNELSIQDLNKTRALPKRRFQTQANNSKKKNLVSSTPNLNAYDFNHQDDIEDDMFVSSAHTSMHQLSMSQTQKPLGILLPAGSRTSFGKEVSFCPVVSKYCWQEQSSEECNDGNDHSLEDDESEDELLDNADATVIYNTKENENIANKYNEEYLKRKVPETTCKEPVNDSELIKEKSAVKEIETEQQLENVMPSKENELRDVENIGIETNDREEKTPKSTINKQDNNETEKQEESNEVQQITATQFSNETPVTAVSLTTNLNNETLKTQTDSAITEQNKRVNNNTNTSVPTIKPTVVVARPLSIQLPILSEPPINRAHHILYASQQMLDNFQKQQENEEYQHFKSQSTQNLNKMSSKTVDLQQQATSNSKLNNNNEIMKSKFKHEEKHPNSKGFLSRFANNFRFSLRRNKKKVQQKGNQNIDNEVQEQIKTNGQTNQAKTKLLPADQKQPDFIHIPLKGPLPQNRNGNNKAQTNGNSANNGNAKNTTVLLKQKGAKTKDTNDRQEKVTGKPPIPPQQQQQIQQLQKMQSAQSSLQQQQQPLLYEVGLSRFYTETETESNNPTAPHPYSVTQDFLTSERGLYNQNYNQQQFTTSHQSCANNQLLTSAENDRNMTAINTNNAATYEFTSPSRATVSQKTQMFNNLSRKSEQPKIGLIETNLDTHETIITGKTRSLINIGPNQQQRYAGNKRLHTTIANSHNHHQQPFNRHHLDGNEADDDEYDDNDEVVVRPDGTVVVIKSAGTNGSSSSQAAQIVSVRRPHKSMEFLLDKENQKDVMTTSEDSTEFQAQDDSTLSQKLQRKKKLRRPFNLRQSNSPTTDSDSDSRAKALLLQGYNLPKTTKCSNYIKDLIFKTFNPSVSSEQICHLNNDLLDKSLAKQVYSPSKIKNAYTLTIMSTPSPQPESDSPDSDQLKPLQRETSRSWPTLQEAVISSDTSLWKCKYLGSELTDVADCKLEKQPSQTTTDSFVDQGFETGYNDAESPVRLCRKPNHHKNKSPATKENPESYYFIQEYNNSSSPISSECTPSESAYLTMTINQEDTKTEDSEEVNSSNNAKNESCLCSNQEARHNHSTTSHLSVTPTAGSSQFWITSGDFTAAVTIDCYEPDRLSLLCSIYAQKSLQNNEMNFGIDGQKFCCNNSATSEAIIAELPQENNCSHYWFSTGDLLIPFRGKKMTNRRIQGFFKSIREFMEANGCLKFGVDGYEFSNILQEEQHSISFHSGQAVSPLRTSDLDQSDVDSQELEKSITFSALGPQHVENTSYSSRDFINSQQANSVNEQSSPSREQLDFSESKTEILKSLENQKGKFKSFTCGQRKINSWSESSEYKKKIRRSVGKIRGCWGH